MAYVNLLPGVQALILYSAVNLHAMRMGPGKHLQGLSLMDGLVKPEEVSATTALCLALTWVPS